MKKRLLSALLVFALMATFVPGAAFAAGGASAELSVVGYRERKSTSEVYNNELDNCMYAVLKDGTAADYDFTYQIGADTESAAVELVELSGSVLANYPKMVAVARWQVPDSQLKADEVTINVYKKGEAKSGEPLTSKTFQLYEVDYHANETPLEKKSYAMAGEFLFYLNTPNDAAREQLPLGSSENVRFLGWSDQEGGTSTVSGLKRQSPDGGK